jgi:hypothetical protein
VGEPLKASKSVSGTGYKLIVIMNRSGGIY